MILKKNLLSHIKLMNLLIFRLSVPMIGNFRWSDLSYHYILQSLSFLNHFKKLLVNQLKKLRTFRQWWTICFIGSTISENNKLFFLLRISLKLTLKIEKKEEISLWKEFRNSNNILITFQWNRLIKIRRDLTKNNCLKE